LNYYTKRSARSENGWGDEESVTDKKNREFVAEKDRKFIVNKRVFNADIKRFLEGDAISDNIELPGDRMRLSRDER